MGGLSQYYFGLAVADPVWVETFLTISNARLQAAYQVVAHTLDQLAVTYIPSKARACSLSGNHTLWLNTISVLFQAGFFVWIYLGHLLDIVTEENELALWLELVNRGVLTIATLVGGGVLVPTVVRIPWQSIDADLDLCSH